jgi:hypothetical protein
MDTPDSLPIRTDPDDTAVRVRSIRARLPGQTARERLETAALLYGPLYGIGEIRQRVAATLPRRVGFVRGTLLEPIESYQESIPDDALLKYDDAVRAGLFARFLVATPAYYREQQVDPWIIAEVAGATDRWVVVAQWEPPRT